MAIYSRISLAALALASAPLMAQDDPVTAPTGEKINQLIVYGDDNCPVSTDDVITVCGRVPEADRYRIPKSLRGDPNDLNKEAWANRVQAYEYVGASGAMSCSASGSAGYSGCGLKEIDKAYAEKAQDPGLAFGLMIAEERQKRLAGIDAEAAQVEERVKVSEKERIEREVRLEEELARKAANPSAADPDAEPLPEPD